MENLPTPFPLLDHPELLVPIHIHTKESLDYARNFPIQDGDVFNVTFPKSGTTWMQEILTMVTSNGDLSKVKTRPNWERVPWLEHSTAKEFLEKRAAPRLISTHLPYEYAPAQLSKGRGKVIYTARNPKDITISYYHFSKFAKFLEGPGDFKDFTNKMIHGTVYMCPWFKHIQGWLDHKDQLDFLYVTFEDMILDLRGNVLRIAEFLGYDLNEGALSAIMDHCTFSSMKDSQMVNYTLVPNQLMDHTTGKFMRKGKVGDWKNHFTVAQSEEFDRVYNQKMKGYDINFIWDI